MGQKILQCYRSDGKSGNNMRIRGKQDAYSANLFIY